MCLFPDFDADNYPLILSRENEFVVVLNIKTKQFLKILDVKDPMCLGLQKLSFLEKDSNGDYPFIT